MLLRHTGLVNKVQKYITQTASETSTLLRKENTTLFRRGVGRDEAVKSITDQLDCKCTEEDEFDDVENQSKDESFQIVHRLHDLVVVRHRRIEC
jgi:hypothetical protein